MIKKKFESGNASNESITLKASSFPKTEQQLITWIQDARVTHIDCSGPVIKVQAGINANEVDEHGFNASNGWLDPFKKCNKVIFKRVVGEANGGDLECKLLSSEIAKELSSKRYNEVLF